MDTDDVTELSLDRRAGPSGRNFPQVTRTRLLFAAHPDGVVEESWRAGRSDQIWSISFALHHDNTTSEPPCACKLLFQRPLSRLLYSGSAVTVIACMLLSQWVRPRCPSAISWAMYPRPFASDPVCPWHARISPPFAYGGLAKREIRAFRQPHSRIPLNLSGWPRRTHITRPVGWMIPLRLHRPPVVEEVVRRRAPAADYRP